MGRKRYPLLLLIVFALAWAALGWTPYDRHDWALENALTFVLGLILAVDYRLRGPLSPLSYTLIFLFALLHTLGSHYTYSLVPYDRWSQDWLGFSFNKLVGWDRNNFDRVIHLFYGLWIIVPVQEIYARESGARPAWAWFFAMEMIMATSMLYEVIEWGAAEVFGGDLGQAYLGTQGDVWDAQKDMVLALLGALVTMGLVGLLNRLQARLGI